MDGYTLAQMRAFVESADREARRRANLQAQFIVALAFDAESYEKLTKDL